MYGRFDGWPQCTFDQSLLVLWLLDQSHDLSNPQRQQSLKLQLQDVCFIAAALDCSTKSRAREIPRVFQDGRPAPKPLRSEDHPEGLPELTGAQAARVTTDNAACQFVLEEIQALADRGGTSIRENPWRSLHWHLPQEVAMMATGQWTDTRYSACVFAGARCKSQCLRHNVDEINQWPPLDCHHSHDVQEWAPHSHHGEHIFPSKEEAEYTAPLAFAIAVAVSWWACRTGRAVLHVPRMPAVEQHGRREDWPPSTQRVGNGSTGYHSGPPTLDEAERARVPVRACTQDVIQSDGLLPPGHIYVGRGHHSHRLPTTCWKSPVTPGHDCSEDDWLPRYVEFICGSDLWYQLPQLHGQVLVCDCPWQSLCEADILAGLVFEATRPPVCAVTQAGGVTRPAQRRRAILLAASPSMATGHRIDFRPTPWSQESVVLAFQKLFPSSWFERVAFPMIEDLLNQPPFSSFTQWLHEHDVDWDGPLNPMCASKASRLAARHTERQQAGAHSHRAALPPLLPFGLSCDEHFTLALARATSPLPTEGLPLVDYDLQYAAHVHAKQRGQLRRIRQQAVGALRELKRRWAKISTVLRSYQPPEIQRVTSQRDLGLTSLLIILVSWSDTGYPFGLIRGLPAVGFAPHYGIFPQQEADPTPFQEVLGQWQQHNATILHQLKPGKHDDVLLAQSMADTEKGFCSPPMDRADLLKFIHGAPHRLIPRCIITQSSGKQRIIDNADTGGQSATSSDSNKLVLCSPFRPAQQIALVLQQMDSAHIALAAHTDAWQSGGEDWPDAYRHSPMGREESYGCIVTWWHQEWQQPAFQVYAGLLFGLPLAVTSFNRYSRLVEALGRRLCGILVSMYFDDASIVDWQSSAGSGQWAFGELNKLLGTPFAGEKRQTMSQKGVFLGLEHDLTSCLRTGRVTFWIRSRLQDKILQLVNQSLQTKSLSSGQASKLYGMANFFEMALYGRVGCGGLGAVKARQYESHSSMTSELLSCFELLKAIVHARPSREFELWPQDPERFVVASDAALEEESGGTGGFLIVWLNKQTQIREGFVADIPSGLYRLWSPGTKKIAQLELMMILYGLVTRPQQFRHRRGIWFVDNIAALMSLVRGRSCSPDLDRIANMIHIGLFALKCWGWWEYIPSKSNWSDSISRLGVNDPWHRQNGFSTAAAFFPLFLWSFPLPALISVFEFL